MLKKPVEAALFDMDGLLLDTEAIYVEAMQEAARTLGYRELPLDFCHSTAGVPGPERNRMIEAHYGDGFSIDAFREQFAVHARRRMDAGIPVKPGVVELLDFLASRGLPLGVATSAKMRTLRLPSSCSVLSMSLPLRGSTSTTATEPPVLAMIAQPR